MLAPYRNLTELQRVVSTNVIGAFATIQAFYPLLEVTADLITQSPSKLEALCAEYPRGA